MSKIGYEDVGRALWVTLSGLLSQKFAAESTTVILSEAR
jgi:hypothetical protein